MLVEVVNDGKLYRVQSGTKGQANAARQAFAKYKIANSYYVRIVQDGRKWRFITGTYPSQAVANNAIAEMKRLAILSYAESMPA
ncbi:SPOR domain-containing protein [Lysinibacillus xylanilyticus]|uniref:SPOR domain-containing protein n=1 Tax=Lysinibacillus xylanilyticus TaxID=582475 RepID=UPI003CFC3ED4